MLFRSIPPGATSITQLLKVDNAGVLTVPGGAAGAGLPTIVLGSNLTKARLYSNNTQALAFAALSANMAPSAAQDDATKPSWVMSLNPNSDAAYLYRAPAGGALAALLTLDNAGGVHVQATDGLSGVVEAKSGGGGTWSVFRGFGMRGTSASPTPALNGDVLAMLSGGGCYAAGSLAEQASVRIVANENWSTTARGSQVVLYTTPLGSTNNTGNYCLFDGAGNLYMSGSVATKASGTTWANPSDPRLKQDVAPYAAGLAELCQLEPITYRLKAQPDGPLCYGFDAEKVRDVFPECVTETRMKLLPDDEEETDGVLSLDIHPMLIALVNAIKELTARVRVLEGVPA